ncbi:uncharacterized protein LOC129571033 [Sitodiplosis mosellana]|uniref:uncharacterized protein LOC129571033 n=1 Tax=Sitodiplosis mosellana TaxID=263140 RepID=UPI0024443F52|nr:uncharacterized protein LOC129571033 [Sitodiplosis mosellana]
MEFWNWLRETVLSIYGHSPYGRIITLFTGPATRSVQVGSQRGINIQSSPNIMKTASICAVISFVGGVFCGPIGLALGGLVGGLTAFGITKWHNNFTRTAALMTFLPTMGGIFGGPIGVVVAGIISAWTAYTRGDWSNITGKSNWTELTF